MQACWTRPGSKAIPKKPMNIDRADVVVIGGGVIGLATAYFTLKAGKDVVLVEKGIPGWEASGRNGGWASGRGHGIDSSRVLQEGIKIWQNLDEELGASTEFVLGGSLFIASTEQEVWNLDYELEQGREAGLEAQRLDLREMREILPGLHDGALAGTFHADSGQANPQLTSQAWAWGINRLGGRIYQDTRVTGIKVESDRIVAVETDAGTIATEQVVNAAGPWSGAINDMVGVSIPTKPFLIEMLCTLPAPVLTKATFYGNVLYCRQGVHGHLHFGGYQQLDIDPHTNERKPTSSLVTGDIARRFVDMVPSTAGVRVLRTWAGIIEASPDEEPILGKMRSPEGYYVNMGYGGLGFTWSPAAGKIMSDLLTTGECPWEIGFLDPYRFEGTAA